MYDVAIIGTGPAGISAALTLKALNKNLIMFGSVRLSEKIRKAECIRNYPGLPQVSGREMMETFSEQLAQMEISITEKTVTGVYAMGDYFGILCNQDMFEAKTVILATGVESVKPVAGELEFLGRGVSYCATCDGFLYKGKTIAVVCTSAEYEHEIEYLADLAQKVYLFPLYRNCGVQRENVEQISGVLSAVEGDGQVRRVSSKDDSWAVDGVFFLKSAVSPATLVPGLTAENGHVVVDRTCKTNLAGLFAAGDCTGRPYQYIKAAGEGNVAAHTAVQFLAEQKK